MTQQQLLQTARNVLTATQSDTGRPALRTAAMAAGRSKEQVGKASTMRLALWVSKGTSAIWLTVTGGWHQPPPPATITESTKGNTPMENYFNTKIVERHADHMWLNNSMAECYDFCLSVAECFDNAADCAWWYDQKKSHLCYDVWCLLTHSVFKVMLSLF
jgi:hypothetical protein